MRLQQYYGLLLLVGSVSLLFLVFNLRITQTSFYRNPLRFLDRYGRQVSSNTDEDSGEGTDAEENRENELWPEELEETHNIRSLVKKLTNKPNTTDEGSTSSSDNQKMDEESCVPEQSIVFLKTHKTGSSTLTNIFNRFADLRELKVALPLPGYNRFKWPLYFDWSSVDMYRLNGDYANVLCNHARYYRYAMDSVMETGAKYVTILREPVSQFESTFDYMELGNLLGLQNVSNAMEVFLRRPYDFLINVTRRRQGDFPDSLNLARNGMFFDLGLSPRHYDNRTKVLETILKLDREFSLVLIMEYYDESLVLLKRELCWDLEDIVYAKFNQRATRKKSKLSRKLRKTIKKWNSADVMLYNFFNKTFWEKIKRHGDDFYKDLKEFRQKNADLQRECVSSMEVRERAVGISQLVRGLTINPLVSRFNRYFCYKIVTNEVEYIKYFRRKFHPYMGYQRQLQQEEVEKERYLMAQSDTPTSDQTWRLKQDPRYSIDDPRNLMGKPPMLLHDPRILSQDSRNALRNYPRRVLEIPRRPLQAPIQTRGSSLQQQEHRRRTGVQFVDIPPAYEQLPPKSQTAGSSPREGRLYYPR